jgi:hypothetical protein
MENRTDLSGQTSSTEHQTGAPSPTPTEVRLLLHKGGHCPLPLQGGRPDVNGRDWCEKRKQTNPDEIQLWDKSYPYATATRGGLKCLCRIGKQNALSFCKDFGPAFAQRPIYFVISSCVSADGAFMTAAPPRADHALSWGAPREGSMAPALSP